MYTVITIAGIAALILSLIAAFFSALKHGKGLFTPFKLVFFGFVCATFAVMVPAGAAKFGDCEFRLLKSVVLALQTVMRFFAFAAEPGLAFGGSAMFTGTVKQIYTLTVLFLFVADPLFTFGFVISFFKNRVSSLRLFFGRGKDAYVFSEPNEKSLALAADIKSRHPDALTVFAGIPEKEDPAQTALLMKIRALRGICYKKDILSVRLRRNGKAKTFIFVNGNEAENVRKSLELIKKYGSAENTVLYVFASDIESELLLSRSKAEKLKIRRVNEKLSVIRNILYEDGEKLFESAVPTEAGDKKIHALILGLGGYGTEMLKALTWFCQMDGYKIEIDAYDRKTDAEDRFKALCPELMSDDYNGMSVPGEAEYLIRVHSGTDIETAGFASEIENMRDVTYAFVSLGTDADNIRAAVNLRMLTARSGAKPMIHAVVRNPEKKEILEDVTCFDGTPYGISYVGDYRSAYSEDTVISSALEAAGFLVHKGYCGGDASKEPDFWRYEYNYSSSVASALHGIIADRLAAKSGKNPDGKKRKDELEHRRWNAYMRASGYVFSGSKDKSSRSNIAKMHNDLTDFSSLSEEERRKDSDVRKYRMIVPGNPEK